MNKTLCQIYNKQDFRPEWNGDIIRRVLDILIRIGYRINDTMIIALFKMIPLDAIHYINNVILSNNNYLVVNFFDSIEPSLTPPKLRSSRLCKICKQQQHNCTIEFDNCNWNHYIKIIFIDLLNMAMALRSAIKNKQINMTIGIICLNYNYHSISRTSYTSNIYQLKNNHGILLDYLVYRCNVSNIEISQSLLLMNKEADDEFDRLIDIYFSCLQHSI